MRFLEIILLCLGALFPFIIASKKVSSNKNVFLIAVIVTLFLHFLLEGVRWQMIPIYLIHIILIICLLKGYAYFKGNVFRKIVSALFLLLLLGIGFLCSTVFPVFEFPTPTGNYSVGAQHLHFTSDAEELITEAQGDKRELMIKVWYPAKIANEVKEIYLDVAERIGFAAKYGLPGSTFNYLDKVKTNTFVSPKIADGKFPVLIFSHGYRSNATGYQALLEEIVSHGYVVFNINHTYESVGTLFPSGEVKLYDSEYDRKYNNQEMATMAWEATEAFNKATNPADKSNAIRSLLKNYFAAEVTHRWTKDIHNVINQVFEWEKTTFLSNHIDTTKIGVFGHSQGAAAIGQVLLDHPKVSAGMNIDGVQWGNMIDTFYAKPFLLLSSDWPNEHPDFNKYIFQNKSLSDLYFAKIKKSGHSNFMDIPFMVKLSLINEAGEIEPEQAIHISAQLVVDFFDKYLNQKNINLLELSKRYPELEMELQ